MARKKVKLAWISNAAARKATLKKRRKGLMKKAMELSVLCDVGACAVVYSPDDDEAPPEAWPSAEEAARVLARFRGVPETEKGKKMLDQEGFLRQQIAKLQEQLQKQEKENLEMEANVRLYQCLSGGGGSDVVRRVACIKDIACLAWVLEMKLRAAHERLVAVEAAVADDDRVMTVSLDGCSSMLF